MHTVVETEDGVWSVVCQRGLDYRPIQDFGEFADAAALCSYLNGGLKPELADRLNEALKIGGTLDRHG